MTPIDIIEWVDTADVWALFAFVAWIGYKLTNQIGKVDKNLELTKQALTAEIHTLEDKTEIYSTKLQRHIEHDERQHERLYDKLEEVRNASSNSG
jgi:predicted DNA-binding protein YlxM (UPF0122 family)